MRRLHRDHDARPGGAREILRTDTLEMLDRIWQRGRRQRLEQIQRAAYRRVADGVDR
jgi:hypothetical protein